MKIENENIFCMHTGVLGVNTYIILLDQKTAAIIDPGGNAEKIYAFLKEKNANLDAILLTHTHFDHIGAVAPLKKQFPNAKIFCHNAEKHFLGKNALQNQLKCFCDGGMENFIKESVENNMPEIDVALNGGEILFQNSENFLNGFKVLHTPGHSEGSICFYNEKTNVLFSGDTLFCGTWGRTDFAGGSETKMKKSLETLLKLPKQTQVFPGHMNFTTIFAEKGLLQY